MTKVVAGWALLLAMHTTVAAELPLLPGIGPQDRRVVLDPTQAPWVAIAKVQTNIGTRCTGVLIAPDVVLTAAHCLYNRRTDTWLQAASLHVLLGYDRGDYRWHRRVVHYTVGTGLTATRSHCSIPTGPDSSWRVRSPMP